MKVRNVTVGKQKGVVMETFEAINKRASLKAHLSSREIEKEKISKILEAARVAPSARNLQCWRFVVVRDETMIESLVSGAFSESNQVVSKAFAVIMIFADPKESSVRDGKEYYLFDAGLTVENMILEATDLGLITHLMTSVDEAKCKEILGVPDDIRFVVATPLAYPAEAFYAEAARERLSQRTRKSMAEIAYSDAWGKPF